MQRIIIIGPCGAGKSTLARRMRSILGLELIHLDQEYWLPNWTEPTKEVWDHKVSELVKKEAWIMDGNYGGSMDIRIARADTIIMLNYSTLKCLYQALKRIYTYHGKVRPDMVEGCEERFDWEFIHYILMFNISRGRKLLKKVLGHKDVKEIYIFKKDKQVKNFLEELKVGKAA